MRIPIRFCSVLVVLMALVSGGRVSAQSFVEYPGHPATYGDHTIATSTWVGGPTTVSVSLETDGTLHGDGQGASQRTARNSLTFVPPRGPANPQNYDDLLLVAEYGDRLPLLQQMSASGTTTLSYVFGAPVNVALDLFLTDFDQSDSGLIRAFASDDSLLNLDGWILIAEGDLSNFKDTGTVFSATVAPPPDVVFASTSIALDAVDNTNYNRSFSVFRIPPNADLSRIEVEFSGTRNSASRAAGGTGSHIYVALSTVPEPGLAASLSLGCALLLRLRKSNAGVRDAPEF